MHCTHWPPGTDVSQTGVVPLQPAVAVQVTQVLVVGLHSGVAPPQFAFDVHCT